MRIRYQSLYGVQRVNLPHALASEYASWTNGEVKDVPEDAKVRWRVADGGEIRVIRAIDAVLSCGPEFVDEATGTNPDFTCAECGKTTNAEGILDVTYTDPVTGSHIRPYENADGERLCIADYLAQHPNSEALHAERGLSSGVLDEARSIRGGVPPAPPAPAPAPTQVAPAVTPQAPIGGESLAPHPEA